MLADGATVNAAANRYGRDEAASGMQAAINACPEGDVVRLSAGAAAVATFQNDDNVRASGLMFGSWWVWTLPARARFDRVMPS
jgi:hypothetical protein